MNFDNIDDIRANGFDGFVAIPALQRSKCCEVPKKQGVYLILRPSIFSPEFLSESIGGHFKGQTPTVSLSELESKWVDGTLVLNIGKAGPGTATLRGRLKDYVQFGQGKAIGHRGGRYIWQLRQSCALLVCWKVISDTLPRTVEKDLLREFEAVYGKLPFANLKH